VVQPSSFNRALKKALQGFLYAQGYRDFIIHSVAELLEESMKVSGQFGQFLDHGKELDRHCIGSKYRNLYLSRALYKFYAGEMAQRCLSDAELLLNEVKKLYQAGD